jgi:hypothetical protein
LKQISSYKFLQISYQELFDYLFHRAPRGTSGAKVTNTDIQLAFKPMTGFVENMEGNVKAFTTAHTDCIKFSLNRSTSPLPSYHKQFLRYNRVVNDEMNEYMVICQDFVKQLGNSLLHFTDLSNPDQSLDKLYEVVYDLLMEMEKKYGIAHENQNKSVLKLDEIVGKITEEKEKELEKIPLPKTVKLINSEIGKKIGEKNGEKKYEVEHIVDLTINKDIALKRNPDVLELAGISDKDGV